MESNVIHVGRMIEAELRRQDRTVSWLARSICHERSSIYKIFSRKSVDVYLLLRISILLNHDFFLDISSAINSRKVSRDAIPFEGYP